MQRLQRCLDDCQTSKPATSTLEKSASDATFRTASEKSIPSGTKSEIDGSSGESVSNEKSCSPDLDLDGNKKSLSQNRGNQTPSGCSVSLKNSPLAMLTKFFHRWSQLISTPPAATRWSRRQLEILNEQETSTAMIRAQSPRRNEHDCRWQLSRWLSWIESEMNWN